MATNPISDIIDKQIAAASSAMQSMLKANQAVYESFQAQINKIVSANTDVITSSVETYMKTVQDDSAAMMDEIRKNLERLKG